ncbi:MAG: Tol-Pal system beta propeller repeat protein TolB [Gammaproteobacteria bacterium]|nr:Tol-Pal system beta propeller repeat protein TolB [Gammaproteobacteria bacterium]NBT45806.1 Tol-Pal system beta propeller repeat protein TolB [Gammaproteobacteria bacterium]NBY23706.1 Tol-Pal system beta propeller repeat protein TolB [Gammaproteobacteria bacterium]
MKIRLLLRLCWFLGGLFLLGLSPVSAELMVDITQGGDGAMPIAVLPFSASGVSSGSLSQVIASDLEGSGKFTVMPASRFPEHPVMPTPPDFPLWQQQGQEHVVIGRVLQGSQGDTLQAEFVLYDVIQGREVLSERVPFKVNEMRHVGHRIADLIYKALTGERGVFNTRVAYVSASGYGDDREYRLLVADSDGEDPRVVMTSPEPIMSPTWSPDGKKIAYVSFEDHAAAIFVQNLGSGERQKVSSHSGINGAPSWSPDGSQLAMTLSKDGSPDIYILQVISGSLRRVTQDDSIETEANWSPDGHSLVLTSDRGGKPQLYVVSAQGGEPRRLTYQGSYNARGVFSPDGRKIAMVHGGDGGYRIGLMDAEGGDIKLLTAGRLDESPAFAPNGQFILYSRKDGGHDQLAMVSIDGKVKQNLKIKGGDVRGASWSP